MFYCCYVSSTNPFLDFHHCWEKCAFRAFCQKTFAWLGSGKRWWFGFKWIDLCQKRLSARKPCRQDSPMCIFVCHSTSKLYCFPPRTPKDLPALLCLWLAYPDIFFNFNSIQFRFYLQSPISNHQIIICLRGSYSIWHPSALGPSQGIRKTLWYGRNLKKSNWGEIDLPGRTNVQ